MMLEDKVLSKIPEKSLQAVSTLNLETTACFTENNKLLRTLIDLVLEVKDDL
jgi:hypothetical protein